MEERERQKVVMEGKARERKWKRKWQLPILLLQRMLHDHIRRRYSIKVESAVDGTSSAFVLTCARRAFLHD